MSTEENKAAERRFYEEVWHKRNLAVIDEPPRRMSSNTTRMFLARDLGGKASGNPST